MTNMTDSEALAVLDSLIKCYPDWEKFPNTPAQKARAHIAEALRDAERYRWIRDGEKCYHAKIQRQPDGEYVANGLRGDALDAAIDAAIEDSK